MSSTHEKPYRMFLDRLREARREADLTQMEVAKRLKKPQSYVSKCESGERRLDIIEVREFASLYGKPLSYFVGDQPRTVSPGARGQTET